MPLDQGEERLQGGILSFQELAMQFGCLFLQSLQCDEHLRPRNFAEAEQLGLLRDQALPFLSRCRTESAQTDMQAHIEIQQAAASVRTLRLINTAAAQKKLEEYR
ncbi:MAG: hypothetical protein NT154_20400, partial [Verrucomicrobia bacterium]|nr:hypothetical protein [Verrucomicrobiota bacterium]